MSIADNPFCVSQCSVNSVGAATAYLNAATVYDAFDCASQSVPLFEKAVRLEPDNVGLQVNLALSLAMSGREREAAAIVSEILRRDPECVPARRLKQALDQR